MANNEKVAVYTAMFNDYDVIINPQYIEDDTDYICFTDDPTKVPEKWETRVVSLDNLSPKLKSGEIKTLPHEYLPEYDQSIWVDANLVIVGKISEFARKLLMETDLAVPNHPWRNCIYKEAAACLEDGLIDEDVTRSHIKKYKKVGFPKEYGLSETRVMVRNHHNQKVIETMEIWWDEYRSGPERDQLSFDYATWVSGINFISLSSDISTNSSLFKYYPHKDNVYAGNLYEQLLRRRWEKQSTIHLYTAFLSLSAYLFLWKAYVAIQMLRNGKFKDLLVKVINKFYRYF